MIRKIYNALALLLITVATAVAQDASTSDIYSLKNKKGETYLPATDEWGLGVSASPFLGYLGNFFNGYTSNNSGPTFYYASNPANNIAIFGKKMVDQNTAYRVRFNVSVNSNIRKEVVLQDRVGADPAYPAFSEDWQRVNTTSVVIAPGYEKRRGSTRLQGIYGGELVIGLSSTKVNYQYGNPITADFTAPETTDFSYVGYGSNIPAGDGSLRVTDNKLGMNFLVGARGFIGVEYFFVPKISIGGEFGYMIAWRTQTRGLTTYELFDSATNGTRTVKVDDYNNGGLTSLGIGIDNLSGSINLLFYF